MITHGADRVIEQSPWLAMTPLTQQDVLSKPSSPLKAHPTPPAGTGSYHTSQQHHRVSCQYVSLVKVVDRANLRLGGEVGLPHWLHSTGQQTCSPSVLEPSIPGTPLLHARPGQQRERRTLSTNTRSGGHYRSRHIQTYLHEAHGLTNDNRP